ncbi:hypothetical protein GLOIN_2v1837705 [Rhizophagus irregularis DAOM 181602=DAOM 197198]|uniref:Uncharacterized protein n=1 Tax=Rhizophagus irregularis (strain DAOM 181602 / DAOM 197198 / MUCL 43194) TaxID=747089 RepID=A0A2P4QHN4_RHIID|nr:hypothetical protein GLOIN_2v1837705 [Rhizophagus irregularis DAOM 181602=DAOM 197198]POG77147.1 hypothetical protein GLOIN_2v1837705 [Rhizophagus irregularis DAOM 181602=DAOM 197198]GBC33544.2 hypothetical protein GLOIN_2v1837705 [Rhizophagus irregularis DAOM 181602=DAOM 197198]|eukprot:XP_025184013.1 hypothetical protein GLOIN_2v1837705 [Rhizophagus irregularis DAOM 181602=DAOM 197198]
MIFNSDQIISVKQSVKFISKTAKHIKARQQGATLDEKSSRCKIKTAQKLIGTKKVSLLKCGSTDSGEGISYVLPQINLHFSILDWFILGKGNFSWPSWLVLDEEDFNSSGHVFDFWLILGKGSTLLAITGLALYIEVPNSSLSRYPIFLNFS